MKKTLFLIFLFLSQTIYAQNCLTGWDWYQPLTIHNIGSEDMVDQQMKFDFNTGALVSDGKLLADGADFRITDGSCNSIPYVMDTAATDSMNSIWVKLSIPANDSVSLQLYYGNDSAEAVANGDDVFLFYDDFSADTVNPDKWEAIGGYTKFEPVDGILQYSSNGENPGPRFKFARTKMSFKDKVHFDYRARISNSNGIGFSSADSTITRIMFRQSVFGFDTLNQVAFMKDTLSNGYQVNGLYPIIRFPRNQYRNASVRASIQDSMLTMDYFANLDENSVSDSVYQLEQEKMSGFHFIVSSFLGSQTIYLDYLRVRKPGGDSLAFNFGAEEVLMSSNNIGKLNKDIDLKISPNPSNGQISIEGLPNGNHSLELVNVQGQQIYQTSLRSFEGVPTEVNLEGIPAGFYWLSFVSENGLLGAKAVIIEKE